MDKKLRKIVDQLYDLQHGRCFHCGLPMFRSIARKMKSGRYDQGYTRDHLVPVKHGGGSHRNLVLAHLKCNTSRGHQMPTMKMLESAQRIWDKLEYSNGTEEMVSVARLESAQDSTSN